MPLLPFLRCTPVRQWPQLIYFFLRNEIVPRLYHRLRYDRPKEVRAMEYAIRHSQPGDPEAVLRALDAFGRREFLMNIGDVKGPLLTAVIDQRRPRVVLELGGYLGYSAIDIARHLPPDGRLISVEMDPLNAALATKLIEWAGLADKVTVCIGASGEVIPTLRERFGVKGELGVVLLDHWKDAYLPDLQLLEDEGYLAPGKSVVVADNVLFPGAPDYLAYVTATKPPAAAGPEDEGVGGQQQRKQQQRRRLYYQTEMHDTALEYNPHIKDLVTVSVPL